MTKQDIMDSMAVLSFIIGVANYNENLTQNDKDDIMRSLDQHTNNMLQKVHESLEEQNAMLREILSRLGQV